MSATNRVYTTPLPGLAAPAEEAQPQLSRALENTLRWLAVPSLAAYAAGMWQSLTTADYPLSVVLTLLFALLLSAGWLKFPYRTRAILLVVVLIGAGLTAGAYMPYSFEARGLILASAGLAALFLGTRAGASTAVTGALALLAGAYLASLGYLPSAGLARAEFIRNGGYWLVTTLTLIGGGMLLAIPAGQLVGALAELAANKQQENIGLFQMREVLAQQNHEQERRLRQLRTISEISHASNSTLNPDDLLTQVAHLIQERFDLYYAGVFLVDEAGEYAVLVAGTGEAGELMLKEGHRLSVGGTSMIGWATANQKARIAQDTGSEPIRFNNPYLPLTRSELALPLVAGNRTIGAISAQSERQSAFEEDDLAALQGLADALATAIENARLFQQLQSSLREIEGLNRQYVLSAWKGKLSDYVRLTYTYENPAIGGDSSTLTTLPLKIRDQVIGDLSLENDGQPWTEEELNLISTVALQATQALENARLLEETQHRAFEERMVAEFSNRVREKLDLDSLLRTAIREIGDRLNLAEVGAYVGSVSDGVQQGETHE